jgi:uncharacterized protein YbjT (DUF2867 family)
MIVITTPTGNIGHHVVQHLLDAGEKVRVVVRDPGKLRQAVRDRVEVVEGSHGDAAVVERAFDGAEAVLWVAPPNPSEALDDTYVNFARPAAEVIRRCGVARVVAVTTLGRGTAWQDRAGLVTASIAMVDLLNETGAAVRGLAMPGFMENALQQVATIRQGQMFGPLDPDKKVPHTSTRDMGAAAARLLRDRSWTGQQDVPLLGPEDLSFNDVAAIISEVLGSKVRYQQVPFDGFKAQLMGRGMSEAFAQGYVDMMRAKNEGMDNRAPGTSADIGPTTFRQWAEDELKPAVLG